MVIEVHGVMVGVGRAAVGDGRCGRRGSSSKIGRQGQGHSESVVEAGGGMRSQGRRGQE